MSFFRTQQSLSCQIKPMALIYAMLDAFFWRLADTASNSFNF